MIEIFFSPDGRTQALVSRPITEQDSQDLVTQAKEYGELKVVYFDSEVDLSELRLGNKTLTKPYKTNLFAAGELVLPEVSVQIDKIRSTSDSEFSTVVDFLHHSLSFDHTQNPPKAKREYAETRAGLERFISKPDHHTYLVSTEFEGKTIKVGTVSLVEFDEYIFLIGVSGISSQPKPKLKFRRLAYLVYATETLVNSNFKGKKLVFTSSKDVIIKGYQDLGYVIKFDINGFRLSLKD
jgi:hypothetical protein